MSMVMCHSPVEIMSRHDLTRDQIIAELIQISHRHVGGRLDLQNIAQKAVAALTAKIDGRTIAAPGHA
jgi:hypothetical protein